jgi:hypothetical protein
LMEMLKRRSIFSVHAGAVSDRGRAILLANWPRRWPALSARAGRSTRFASRTSSIPTWRGHAPRWEWSCSRRNGPGPRIPVSKRHHPERH